MKFSKYDLDRIELKWPAPYSTYEEATKVVYSWVKQDKISPETMAELLVDAYKHFVY
jgi:oligoribonuclease NrnB/cAMP/cGMP phosphodiesterase (DHH superfamily)